jgi:hypothetical protein
MVQMGFPGLAVVVTSGRNTVFGIAYVSQSDPASSAVGFATFSAGRVRNFAGLRWSVPVPGHYEFRIFQ